MYRERAWRKFNNMNLTTSWGFFRSGGVLLDILGGVCGTIHVSDLNSCSRETIGFRENKIYRLFHFHTVKIYTHFLIKSAKKPYSLAPAHTYSACVSEYPLARFRVKRTYSDLWLTFTRFATRVGAKYFHAASVDYEIWECTGMLCDTSRTHCRY